MALPVDPHFVRVFAISPRTIDVGQYWTDILDVAAYSERSGFTGVLLFTGNDVYVEPWVVAQHLLARHATLTMLVAVNPVYMHPFAVAKIVMSLSRLYERKLYLNLVIGTAVNYLESLGDQLSHDERYERLAECGTVVTQLLAARRPISFQGRFYQITNAQLLPGLSAALQPELLLAGQSPAALACGHRLGAIGMQMLAPTLDEGLRPGVRGVHFGVVTRPDDADAWRVARELFPESPEGQEILDLSMANTDSSWKRRLRGLADRPIAAGSPYWLSPFRHFQADCPYVVGSHACVAGVVARLIQRGIDTFILDIPPQEEEFRQVAQALALARATDGAPVSQR
jgi:alkanesulfonate monooxygenase